MIRLVRAELHLMEAALAGDDALARALGHDVVAGWATFTEALPPNASNRVLEKAGFQYDGEAMEHGRVVWRFALARSSEP
jgi:hypothetical protein